VARRKPRKPARGLSYDAATRTAKISVYIKGRKGRARLRQTLHDVSLEEAEKVLVEFRARANRGSSRPSIIAPTLREFYDTYFDLVMEGRQPSTVEGYRMVIEHYVLETFGETRLSDITTGAVNLWVKELIQDRRLRGKRPLAGATINGYANVLRALVNHAVRFDIIEESPFKRSLERADENKPKNELTEQESAAFLRAFRDRKAFLASLRSRHRAGAVASSARFKAPRAFGGGRRWDSPTASELWARFRALRPFFVVALTTGLRLGDLCRLSWENVRWKEGWIQLVMEKTKREVIVPIAAPCAAALRECQERPVVGELVFVDEGGLPLSITRIRRTFALAKKLAGITRKVRFHDLRHTYGSSLASDGLSLAIIGKVMGHADQATTARYARPDQRVLDPVRKSMDERYGSPRPRRRSSPRRTKGAKP